MSTAKAGAAPARGQSRGADRRWIALAVLCVAALVISVDLTVLQLAIPSLTEDMNPSASQILWIADIYGLVMAGLLITMGIIGDRIGRKKLLVLGAVLFGGASALTAWAPNPESLIAGRALLGVAGATIYPTTLSIIRNIFTNTKERTVAIGIWTGMISGGTALGPIVGGPLLNNFWWGSVFLINVPLMAVVFLGGLILLPESRNPKPGRLDLFSVVLSVIGILAVVYAIQESVRDGFGEPRIYGTAAAGVVALLLFVWRQTRLAEPILDVHLFRNRAFSGAFVANSFTMFGSVGVLLLISQYLQFVHDWSPMRAALALLPPAGMGMICAPLVVQLIPRLGQARTVALGLALLSSAMFLYSRADVNAGYTALLIPTLLHGIAVSCIFACTVEMIVSSAPPEKSGIASGIATTGGELGAAMGMAVLGTVLNTIYHRRIDLPDGVTGQARRLASDSLGSAIDVAGHEPAGLSKEILASAKSAFMDGMHLAVVINGTILLAICLFTLYSARGLPKILPHHEEEAGRDTVPGQTQHTTTDAGVRG
ncbi:MFS transporter [Streptomyces sp. NBC_00986]|uniref:MFS transporter n=1 Tax=Streptomyces sp. NBC_00986 TaxID=2903702 RepID=UPI003866FD49|nr:MFS transporter [Streptomyces sp. NBC_00986]WSX64536.1 MFS transporter [Streptomyces sp. NBC_00986]